MKFTCILGCSLALLGCGDDGGGGPDGGGIDTGVPGMDTGVPGDAASTEDSSLPDDGGPGFDAAIMVGDGGTVSCGDHICECNNGEDDDGDGLVDLLDPECTGPADDDEDSFATGIPGDNVDEACQDCFFDGNSGAGDDGCFYATSCLTTGMPSGHGRCATCDVTDRCVDFCRARTPNGCDCFGCCEVHLDGGDTVFVRLGGMCSLEDIDDETECPPCMQDDECTNECEECELCPGRTVDELPASCFEMPDDGGPPPPRCADGETPCATASDCESGFFCQLGCCIPGLF